MALFDGFPFVSKDELKRRQKEQEKRICPFGLDDQRAKAKQVLAELLPGMHEQDRLFSFFDAKDAYEKAERGEPGRYAARARLKRMKWVDGSAEDLMLKFIELESAIGSLDDYPTAEQVRHACGE